MKKLIWIVLLLGFLIGTTPCYSKEAIIETKDGKVTVYIPETKAALEEAMLQLLAVCYDQRIDIDALVNLQNIFQADILELRLLHAQYENLLLSIKNVEVYKPKFIRQVVMIGSNITFEDPFIYDISLGYGILLLDRLQIIANIEIPFELGLKIGIIF